MIESIARGSSEWSCKLSWRLEFYFSDDGGNGGCVMRASVQRQDMV